MTYLGHLFNNESVVKLDFDIIFPYIIYMLRYMYQEKFTEQSKYYVYQNTRKEMSFLKFQGF